jgi:hypothetical protein
MVQSVQQFVARPLEVQPAPAKPVDNAQRLVIGLTRVLQNSGLQVQIRHDLAAWAETVRGYERNDGVNPTFDVQHTDDLTPDRAFWIDVTEGEGTPVACIAYRVFHTGDFCEHMADMSLWHPRIRYLQRQELVVPADVPLLAGRVGHGGGMVVERKHSGRGLSWILPRMARALGQRLFDVNWYTSMEMEAIYDRGMHKYYGNAHTVPCIDGIFRARKLPCRAYLSYMDAAEMSAQQAVDVGMLIQHDCHDLADLRLLVGERKREAPVVVEAVA